MRKLALAFLLLAILAATVGAEEFVNRIAAVVDEEAITLHEIESMARPLIAQLIAENPDLGTAERDRRANAIKRDILQKLIEQKLIEREVLRLGIEVTETEIDAYIERVKKANSYTDETLNMALIQQGISMAEFRERIKLEILRDQYVSFRMRDKLRVKDEDIRAYYENHPEEFAGEPVVRIAEIRLNLPPNPSEEQVREIFVKINEVYEKLLAGGDFAELARQYSQGPTAADGGMMGSLKMNSQLKPVYNKAVTPLEVGKHSTIFRDENGFFILLLIEKTQVGLVPFAEVEDKIAMRLRKVAAEREMERLAQELYKKSFVDIRVHFGDQE
ncbi:MAG TPA: SurA N-terminal domain-containing protein [bacterium]|nr:SurA N-terminal domain-containing protein [bacterium]